MRASLLKSLVFSIAFSVSYGKLILPDEDGSYTIYVDEFKNEKVLNFSVLGDWGGFPPPWYTTPIQLSAAKLLERVAERDNVKFHLAIGDNFYFNGVKDIYDRRWYQTYESIYTAPSVQIPWYPSLGNHDWQGNTSAQISYSALNWRWTMPNYFYKIQYVLAENVKLTFLMLDTQIHCDSLAGETKITQYPERPTMEQREAQLEWLKSELEKSKDDDYLFIVGHYHIHTCYGYNTCMRDIDQLMREYKTSAYIFGHRHEVSHLVSQEEPRVDYIGSGYGAMSEFRKREHEFNTTEVDVKYFKSELRTFKGGFITFEVSAEQAKVHYYYDWMVDGVGPMDSKYEDAVFTNRRL